MKRTTESDFLAMRKFHNRVKQELVYQAREAVAVVEQPRSRNSRQQQQQQQLRRSDGPCLLDYGCGRGGDLWKWHLAGFQDVLAYDPCASSVEEARRRLKESPWNTVRNYLFTTSVPSTQISTEFDVVSCQFAIHYLFESHETLCNFVGFVAQALRSGGRFIGTFLDADRVLLQPDHYKHRSRAIQIICGSSSSAVPASSSASVLRGSPPPVPAPGHPVSVFLTGTLYFGETTVSHEFLVYRDVLTKYCASVGLDLVEYVSFDEWARRLQRPPQHPDCTEVSALYTSFEFKKRSSTAVQEELRHENQQQ